MTEEDVFRGGEESGGGYGWEEAPGLTSSSEEERKESLKKLSEEEERAISYRWRVIQGRIDLIRAELVRRGGVTLSPEELAPVLLGGQGSPERGEGG